MLTNDTPELKTDLMHINLGPSHPSMHGTLHLDTWLDGERIVKVTPHLGYLHTGFEKLGEYLTYNQFITLTDRMNYLSPVCNNIGIALAVEKLLEITVPPRGQRIRVILAELSRIMDHLVSIGMQAVDIGAFTAFLFGFRQKEMIYNIFEVISGARFTTSYTRVGGLFRDVEDEKWVPLVQKFCKDFPKALKDIDSLLTRNKIWVGRTQNVGVITKEEAIQWGASGPVLRATGMDWDLRKNTPYMGYEQFNFEIPVGTVGDTYDRYMVRMEEIRQSLRIVDQAIQNIPQGPVNVEAPKIVLPPKNKVYTRMEELIHQFKIVMEGHGFETPKGEVYMGTESPNGELGFFISSDGSAKPYRMRVRPPSFVHFQLVPKLIVGHMLSDVVAILSSLNIIAGELDR